MSLFVGLPLCKRTQCTTLLFAIGNSGHILWYADEIAATQIFLASTHSTPWTCWCNLFYGMLLVQMGRRALGAPLSATCRHVPLGVLWIHWMLMASWKIHDRLWALWNAEMMPLDFELFTQLLCNTLDCLPLLSPRQLMRWAWIPLQGHRIALPKVSQYVVPKRSMNKIVAAMVI